MDNDHNQPGDDAWDDAHSDPDHHSGWVAGDDDVCPIMGNALTDEQGELLPF